MVGVAIVTGGNKGIGFGICKGLSRKFNGDVYLTARSEERGKAALADLKKQGFKVHFHQLDIDDPDSVKRLRDFMKEKYGGIDILVNNAAIFINTETSAEPIGVQAEKICRTNYWSTKNVCDTLFPLLRSGARVVNVSSAAGLLQRLPESEVKKKLKSSGKGLTVEELDDIVRDFVASAKDGSMARKGYNKRPLLYSLSKIGLSALTRIQQEQFDKQPELDLVVNHIQPGYVDTDMTSHRGNMTIDQGAKSSIYAALLPPKTPIRGQLLWDDCSIVDWETRRFPLD